MAVVRDTRSDEVGRRCCQAAKGCVSLLIGVEVPRKAETRLGCFSVLEPCNPI